jgi:hypothetical protein
MELERQNLLIIKSPSRRAQDFIRERQAWIHRKTASEPCRIVLSSKGLD